MAPPGTELGMRARAAAAAAVLFLAGCGVSKDVYQAQVVRAAETEARISDLEARLHVETARREALAGQLAERDRERGKCAEELARAQAKGQDLESQLSRCSGRESGLLADVDLCRKARTAAETARDGERSEKERLRATLEGDLSNCRADLARTASEARMLADERERLEREKREKLDEISRTYEGLLEGMKEELDRGRVTITQLKGKLSVNLLDEILFDSGSAAVKPEGREVLDQVGEALKGVGDRAIVIEGHTDDVAIAGELAKRFPTNWELSAARAISVVRYLQEAAGLPPERLSAVGFGAYRPLESNETPAGRARNRRIEIKLVPVESPGSAVQGAPTPPGASPSPDAEASSGAAETQEAEAPETPGEGGPAPAVPSPNP